jgi:hypothetical protein
VGAVSDKNNTVGGTAITKKGKGGLRKGHEGASDEASKKIDRDLKAIRDQLAIELSGVSGLTMKVRIPKTDTLTPCEPDGGAWYYRDDLVAVFEAKKQQDKGNAIERWYKNMYRCRKLNQHVSYVTFCRGSGAHPAGQMGKLLDVAHEQGWDEYFPEENSCWLSPSGFTYDWLYSKMREVIYERVQAADDER